MRTDQGALDAPDTSVGSSTVAMNRVFSMVMQPGRTSMQPGAALAPHVSQRAFKTCSGQPGRWRHTRSRNANY
jgi:hypothetical protein